MSSRTAWNLGVIASSSRSISRKTCSGSLHRFPPAASLTSSSSSSSSSSRHVLPFGSSPSLSVALGTSLAPRRPLSTSSQRGQQPRISRFDTSMKSDVKDSSIDPSSPTVLSNIVDSSPGLLIINKFSERGLELSDGTVTRSGIIIIENQAFGWDVDPPVAKPGLGVEGLWKEWGDDRFKLLDMITPRPEILLFGTGARPLPLPQRIRDRISRLGISIDVMDSRNAASTFNLLQEEGRNVAVALCPLKPRQRGGASS